MLLSRSFEKVLETNRGCAEGSKSTNKERAWQKGKIILFFFFWVNQGKEFICGGRDVLVSFCCVFLCKFEKWNWEGNDQGEFT